MKTIRFLLPAFLALTVAATAQTPDYVFKYDDVHAFVEGIAAVERLGKTGYIDAEGREIVPPKYDAGADFSEGLARVTLAGKTGFINPAGEEVLPLRFDLALSFAEGRAFAKLDGKWTMIDRTGRVIASLPYELVSSFEDGLARVGMRPSIGLQGETFGCIDRDGETVIPVEYNRIERLSSEVLAANRAEDNKWGLLDRAGQTLAPFIYDDIGDRLADGFLAVRVDKKWGFINAQGKEAIPLRFGVAYNFSDGIARVTNYDDNGASRHGLIDAAGREIIPLEYEVMAHKPSEGLLMAGKGGAHGFMDLTGRTAVPLRYKDAQAFSEGLAAVSFVADPATKERRWGYIDPTGKTVIEPRFEYAEPFKEGFAVVGTRDVGSLAPARAGYTKGFVSKTGQLVVPLSYDNARPFADGMAAVNVGQNTDTLQDHVSRDVTGAGTLSTGKWGFIDTTGKVVIEPQFADVKDFRNGYAVVNLGATLVPRPGGIGAPRVSGGKWGLIDRTGTLVLPAQFDSLSDVLDTGVIHLTAGGNTVTQNITAIVGMARGAAAIQAGKPAEARQHFLKAAEHGNATAVGYIGLMHAQGAVGPGNLPEARKWLTWGAERGDAQSMMNLAALLAQANQRADALAWFKRAEAAGHPQARAAHEQLSRQPAPSAPPAARERPRERTVAAPPSTPPPAAAALSPQEAFRKGMEAYRANDYPEAMKWFRPAAEQGHSVAMLQLGTILYYGRGGVEKDTVEGRAWLQKAADAGSPLAKGLLDKTDSP